MNKKIKWNEDAIRKCVAESISKSEVIKKMGGDGIGGGWYRMINRIIKLYEIDTTHFKGQGWSKGKTGLVSTTKVKTEDLLVRNSPAHGSSKLRKRLIKEGILKDVCCECGCDGNWMGKMISLQLDHKNGDHIDNRIENLRILCPNCHAATKTYCIGNRKQKSKSTL